VVQLHLPVVSSRLVLTGWKHGITACDQPATEVIDVQENRTGRGTLEYKIGSGKADLYSRVDIVVCDGW